MKQKAWIGIDPGKTGALALITADNQLVEAWPGDAASAADLLSSWRFAYSIELAALECVHAMPGQGVKSMFPSVRTSASGKASLQPWPSRTCSHVHRTGKRAL